MDKTRLLITTSGKDSVLEIDTAAEARWITYRRGNAGKLIFTLENALKLDFSEGCAVRFYAGEYPLFSGYVFSKRQKKNGVTEVTAYDSMRYLACRDVCVYENKTASELIKMLAADYGLTTGVIEDTGFVIGSRVEENSTVLEIMENALEITENNTNKRFVLYDSFGALSLREQSNMRIGEGEMYLMLDEEAAEDFEYLTSIDGGVYNKVKLIREDRKSGRREVYIRQDNESVKQWGTLQYFGKLSDNENGTEKAKSLLENYGKKQKRLEMSNVFGDARVRAGSCIAVKMNAGINEFMTVERAEHNFFDGGHFMDLVLAG